MKTKKVDTIKFDVHKQYTYITVIKNRNLSDKEITNALENAGYELGRHGIKRQTSKK